jgi:hypothetical protein
MGRPWHGKTTVAIHPLRTTAHFFRTDVRGGQPSRLW